MDKFKLTNDRSQWMDFVYDVNNSIDGYKLVDKDNIRQLYTSYTSLDGSGRWFFKWYLSDEVRNKIIHNYEK